MVHYDRIGVQRPHPSVSSLSSGRPRARLPRRRACPMKMHPGRIAFPCGGERVPAELKDLCVLEHQVVVTHGDEGAGEIYSPLKKHVQALISIPIARAILDLNRAEDNSGVDGVIKNHTCGDVAVYRRFPANSQNLQLLAPYYQASQRELSAYAGRKGIGPGIDCHTMSSVVPPARIDPGREGPLICLRKGDGACPAPCPIA